MNWPQLPRKTQGPDRQIHHHDPSSSKRNQTPSETSSSYFASGGTASGTGSDLSGSSRGDSTSNTHSCAAGTSTLSPGSSRGPWTSEAGDCTTSCATATVAPTRSGTTTGTRTRTTKTPSIFGGIESHTIICAVSEARGVSPSVGLALVNVTLGVATLSQICDNQSYVNTIHKMVVAEPSHMVFMSTVCPPSPPSILYSMIETKMQNVELHSLERSAWSEMDGIEYIQNLAFETDIAPIKVAVQGKFYATASFAAV